jgi:hypothetical protein
MKEKRIVKDVLIPSMVVLVSLLFVIGLIGCRAGGSKESAAREPDIVIRYRGLMAFDKEPREGVEVVRLLSGIKVAHHRISIQIKTPELGSGFIEWGDDYGKDEVMKLEVTDANPPMWASGLPFNIATLHPHSEHGDLVYKPNDTFQPIFTINQGTLYGDDPTTEIEFVNDNGGSQDGGTVHREVVAKIYLNGQKARLFGRSLPEVDLTRGPSEIIVSNNPSLAHVYDKASHFSYYYEGFQMSDETDIPQAEKYRAVKKHQAIETRPCIPISF